MQQLFSNRYLRLSTIATVRMCAIEIWNQKISYLKPKMITQISKSSISGSQRFLMQDPSKDSKEWRLRLERHTTFLLKYWQGTMISLAICGQLVAFCTFYYVAILLSMVMMTKRFWEWLKKVNLILMEKNGMMFQMMPKIWLRKW